MDAMTLARCSGARIDRAQRFAEPITAAMAEFGIDTPARQAAFLAQIGHESGFLKYTVELWGPTEAQKRYEGRKDLGNLQIGDGYRFRGRGLLQTTGRANYKATGDELGVDLEAHPELLGEPVLASRSAGHYWQSHGLNRFADSGDFVTLTKRINGGTNGLAERQILWAASKAALGVTS
ncbi:glycoside hydrolase family 19 protein [Variovorax paradoxus]|nr:glycoside hydrolase family 19 protein [Variovorax paradoxus]